jgi:hypothetical protein
MQLIQRETSRSGKSRAKSTIADGVADSATSSTNPNPEATWPNHTSSHITAHVANPSDSLATATGTGGMSSIGLDVRPTAHNESFSFFASSSRINDSPYRTARLSDERIWLDVTRPDPSSSGAVPAALSTTSGSLRRQNSGVDVSKHLDPEIREQHSVNYDHATLENRESRAKGLEKSRTAHEDPSKL